VSEENTRLARRALEEIYSKGNLEPMDELIHPEFRDHEPSHPDLPIGPEAVSQTVERLHETFSELRFEVHQEVAEGDRVVQLVTMSGRQTGPMMGSPPTGREFAVRHTYWWRVADGRLAEHWGVRDDLGLLTQLGLFPGGS
jgi:predicted ester cyclase